MSKQSFSTNNHAYLLDTHIFLWWLDGDKRLPDSIRKLIGNPDNHIFVSVVNGLEMSIKHQAGKLPLKTTVRRCFEISHFDILPIILEHILALDSIPLHHKDPFDRLLISQAKVENLILITLNPKIKKYDVKTME